MRHPYRLLALLIVIDLLVVILHYWFGGTIRFFHLDKEQNLASVYSGSLLLAGAVMSFGACIVLGKMGAFRDRVILLLLGLGLFYLAIDEMVVLHERIGLALNYRFGLTGYKGSAFNWVIYYTPAMIASVFVFWGVLRMLWMRECQLFIIALVGVFVLFFSLGAEALGGRMLQSKFYTTISVIEEFAEMVGESFLLVVIAWFFTRLFHEHYTRRPPSLFNEEHV
ncbi:hypothetical protein HY624_00500 [Candidatus Uhrbacteria bacterium]|nr:hypothetical protein [Candidatus Uhrbacteria bacterium]